jgi:KUP system potassium uptake protein
MTTTATITGTEQPALRQAALIGALGVVFGDIGTSPLYAYKEALHAAGNVEALRPIIFGCVSLVFWALIIVVSIKYVLVVMRATNDGEGGIMALTALAVTPLKVDRWREAAILVGLVGAALFYGDCIITPAISVLSAVEGLEIATPVFKPYIVPIAASILAGLFILQSRGTARIGKLFGPIMIIWFSALAFLGVFYIFESPVVLNALNPYWGMKFLLDNKIKGFIALGEIILCATVGEALYADMGHLRRKPIIRAWYFVFCALLLNYLGQGAFILSNAGYSSNILFGMIFHQSFFLYIPFLILSIIATIIASQAMISGMFSVVYQGINTRLMPLFKVEYTSTELRSQIYIGFVNWFLLLSVLFIMFQFRESNRLAAAYGLAVTGTMTLTGIMMTAIFYLRKENLKTIIAFLVTLADLAFLTSNMNKIPHGGYWSLIIAAIPLAIIMIYTGGQRKLYRTIRPLKLDVFLHSYNEVYQALNKIKGTALFFARDMRKVPSYIVHTMFMNNIIYEDNIIVSITTLDEPFGVESHFKDDLAPGLRAFEIQMGYMEVVDIEQLLKKAGINEKGIFYGLEEIATRNIIWKIFSMIKRLAPPFVQFQDLPPNKLHGVVTRIEL